MDFRDVLRENHRFLKENVDAELVLDYLYQYRVFSLGDYDRCLGRATRQDQCQAMLETLRMKGTENYKIFCGILHDTQRFIKDKLDGSSKGIRELSIVSKKTFDEELGQKNKEIERLRAVILEKQTVNEDLTAKLSMMSLDRVDIMQTNDVYTSRCQRLEKDKTVHWLPNSQNEEQLLICPNLSLTKCGNSDEIYRISQFQDHWVPFNLEHQTAPVYWETHQYMCLPHIDVFGSPLFKLGLYDDTCDTRRDPSTQNPTWGVSVELCLLPEKSVCTRVWANKLNIKCYKDTMSNTPGTRSSLNFGTVLDPDSGKLAFIDNNRGVILCKFEVDYKKTFYQILAFGTTLKAKSPPRLNLITGDEIDMDNEKQNRIRQVLH